MSSHLPPVDLALRGRYLAQVQFVAEGAAHGNERARALARHPLGDVIGHHAVMRTYGQRGEHVRAAVLNLHAHQRVGVVRAPDLRAIEEHAQVESSSAPGAAFEANVGEGRCEHAVQLEHAERVAVHHLALPVGGYRHREGLGKMSIHVPFDVRDVRRAQDTRDLFKDVLTHFGAREVEHQLIPPLVLHASGHVEAPVRVGRVQLAVGRDHLGFDPQPEQHAFGHHIARESADSERELFRVGEPVTE
mmetsp:Transcript_6804/g.17661  ORF Transcript_6804/g.17661 Transcript_6804/m.17661 type:complete len:247 (+) Transcript_6804:1024-1764(+)